MQPPPPKFVDKQTYQQRGDNTTSRTKLPPRAPEDWRKSDMGEHEDKTLVFVFFEVWKRTGQANVLHSLLLD